MIGLNVLILSAMIAQIHSDISSSSLDRQPYCGLRSLFILLQLQGLAIHLDAIEQLLPASGSKGHSMADLQDAARGVGLRLKGIRVRERDLPLDRSSIAYMNYQGDGHFIVLRPVGTTGTMVQIIEPPNAPRIVDYTDLLAHPAWTGKLLVPESTTEHFFPWIVGAGVGMIAASASIVFRRVQGRRK